MADVQPPKPATGADKSAHLEALDIFKAIDPATVDQIARRAQNRTLEKGELLFNVGDTSDALYVIAEGRVRIWTVSAAGAEVTLNVLTSGAVFGEIGMLDGGVRTAGASAMLRTRLTSIARRTFYDALDRDPQLVRNVIDLLCGRLRWTSARMEDATLRQAPQRLARILGHLARDHGKATTGGIEVVLKLTQSEMAQWTAMSREGLNKLLNRWSEERLLSQDRGGLIVHDLDRIDEIAEFGE
ncbi:Crp/Fnr family transcriptional regulator [Microvirga yunnanensis]|uniref:Crp/Fnr family transcriptional regulator n=1 Tax=Microvirga yunnanensis TaxID=2953740 RepID=UPI0021C9C0CF|nr:Crp/Fnr family transcriptional regulator [Microvirga sp. HBU65207]